MKCSEKYFESVNREETAENAFFESSSKNYNIIFFIHIGDRREKKERKIAGRCKMRESDREREREMGESKSRGFDIERERNGGRGGIGCGDSENERFAFTG